MPQQDQTYNNLHPMDRHQISYMMGRPPSWMMQYGITVVSTVVILLISLTYFIQYPDVAESKIMLTTANPPIRIIAQSSGQIAELLVSEKQLVKENEVVAILENTANWRDVLWLEVWLREKNILVDTLLTTLNLGELQSEYSVFSEHKNGYDQFILGNNSRLKIEGIKARISLLKNLNNNLQQQKKISERQFQLIDKDLVRQGLLFQDYVIADKEYEATEMKSLQQMQQMESADAIIIQNTLQIKGLEAEAIQVEQEFADEQIVQERVLQEDTRKLISIIELWKKKYLVIAPIAGHISLSKVWRSKQSITSGEEILAVVPEGDFSGEIKGIIGKSAFASQQAFKIKIGQVAIIHLDGFPVQDYGTIEGSVTGIASIPQNEMYNVDLYLSDTLVSNLKKTIPFRQEMTGRVKIITENRRVLERIFSKFKELIQLR